METKNAVCRYCKKTGAIKYYYLGLPQKVKLWCSDDIMCYGKRETTGCIMKVLGFLLERSGMAPGLVKYRGFGILIPTGFNLSDVISAHVL